MDFSGSWKPCQVGCLLVACFYIQFFLASQNECIEPFQIWRQAQHQPALNMACQLLSFVVQSLGLHCSVSGVEDNKMRLCEQDLVLQLFCLQVTTGVFFKKSFSFRGFCCPVALTLCGVSGMQNEEQVLCRSYQLPFPVLYHKLACRYFQTQISYTLRSSE